MNLLIIAGFVSWCAWALMTVIGVLHGAGAISFTLGYDDASIIAWCVIPISVFRSLWFAAIARTMRQRLKDHTD